MTSDYVIQRMTMDLGTSARRQSEAKSRRQRSEIKVFLRLPSTKQAPVATVPGESPLTGSYAVATLPQMGGRGKQDEGECLFFPGQI